MFVTDDLFFFRKPAGIPTSRGNETCFLDLFAEGSVDMDRGVDDYPHFIEAFEQIRTMGGYELTTGGEARQWLLEEFSMREEYGLLNRLDTDTAGMLYFARSREVYEQRRDRQRQGKVKKWYLAQVEGDCRASLAMTGTKEIEGYEGKVGTQFFVSVQDEGLALRFPMMHHKHDECMVSCVNNDGMERMMRRGRGKVLQAESWVKFVSYDPDLNTSIVRVMIHHGWRHQIRVHLAMLGNPIISDALYGNGNKNGKHAFDASVPLQLVSCGCSVEKK